MFAYESLLRWHNFAREDMRYHIMRACSGMVYRHIQRNGPHCAAEAHEPERRTLRASKKPLPGAICARHRTKPGSCADMNRSVWALGLATFEGTNPQAFHVGAPEA